MNKGVCIVVGVGPGNGAEIARKFADQGYRVALCARNIQRLEAIAVTIPGSRAYGFDVQEPEAHARVFAQIREELGPADVLVYNAGAGDFVNVEEASMESFQSAWEINARGLFLASQQVLPDMRAKHGGSIIVIGATGSVKGGANAAPFSSAKFAQRGLAQSMARRLGPKKIHVAYVILDGMVHPGAAMAGYPDEYFMAPADIAESVYFLTEQSPQAWTFELDLRVFGEKW